MKRRSISFENEKWLTEKEIWFVYRKKNIRRSALKIICFFSDVKIYEKFVVYLLLINLISYLS